MEIINGSDRLPVLKKPLFLALGNFDGVHRGHQAILKKAVNKAVEAGGLSAAYILNPHPVMALRPENQMSLLTDIVDRAEIMGEIGLDYLIVETFNEDLSQYTPDRFIQEILDEKLRVSGLFVGSNYRFGRQGAGSADTLLYWGKKLGFSLEVSPMVYNRDKKVSSSLIRSLIIAGAVREAADYLNYYFYRHGRVIKGCGIGKKMVYPTANIKASPQLIWPGKGVYLTAVGGVSDQLLYGLTNVGSRPTFANYDETAVETHILDFNEIIYGREIRLCFLEKIRDTHCFPSATDLKIQISRDIEEGRKLINDYRQERNGKGCPLQASCSVLRSF
ncbi:MAG: bifunctional riboflavin kinase/FAD synthetase [Firmicutes bacterium]|nr:bifunctional riboflavin kinase/FAD synthetase [Bacillota bacterium]